MSNYRAQYKISQDAIVKYADDVRRLEAEVKEKERIIKNLKKVIGEIDREDKLIITQGDKKLRDYGPPYGPHSPQGNKEKE